MGFVSKRFFNPPGTTGWRRASFLLIGGCAAILIAFSIGGTAWAAAGALISAALMPVVARRTKVMEEAGEGFRLEVASSVRLPGGGRVHAVRCEGRIFVVGASAGRLFDIGTVDLKSRSSSITGGGGK